MSADRLLTPPEDHVRHIIEWTGEDPDREGLNDTPERYIRMMEEMTSGYRMNPADVLRTTFDIAYDEMVVVTGVRFASLCEHHLLPFTGTAAVGYIPGERVVGLSKLARIVDVYARRLQVQERLTVQVAQALDTHLQPVGAGVVIRATHHCMAVRGVRQHRAEMVTSALHGALRDKGKARAEFLALARDGV